jgi:hypothetical protein
MCPSDCLLQRGFPGSGDPCGFCPSASLVLIAADEERAAIFSGSVRFFKSCAGPDDDDVVMKASGAPLLSLFCNAKVVLRGEFRYLSLAPQNKCDK